MSQLREIAEQEHKMDMTPMIDVTFLLLIFFLCTIKFKTLEGKLSAYLPKDVGVNTTKAEPKPKIEIKLEVVTPGIKVNAKTGEPFDPSSKARFTYKDRRVRYKVDSTAFESLDKVRDRLRQLKDSVAPDTSVAIDPRKDTVYADVAKVLDVVLEFDFSNVSFVGSYEK